MQELSLCAGFISVCMLDGVQRTWISHRWIIQRVERRKPSARKRFLSFLTPTRALLSILLLLDHSYCVSTSWDTNSLHTNVTTRSNEIGQFFFRRAELQLQQAVLLLLSYSFTRRWITFFIFQLWNIFWAKSACCFSNRPLADNTSLV